MAHVDPLHHILLGHDDLKTPQYGILGTCTDDNNRIAAINLNDAGNICLFGAPGSGKSYCMGTIIEMASVQIPGINVLQAPLATVLFHYSPSEAYKPEFLTLNQPNRDPKQIAALREYRGADVAAVAEVIRLAPRDAVDRRKIEDPGIPSFALTFRSDELDIMHWQFLMGAVGEGSVYVKVLFWIMRDILRAGKIITPALLLERIDSPECHLSPYDKDQARIRCQLVNEYIDDDGPSIKQYLKPGRIIQVDLRDPFLLKDEALTLLIVLLQLFASVKRPDGSGLAMPKLICFDECHKLMENKALVKAMVELIREMRHQSAMLMFASQDPPSVPLEVIELATHLVLLKFNSPLWLQHMQKVNSNLGELRPSMMTKLKAGEAYVWAARSSLPTYTEKAFRYRIRTRATQHGGATKSAVMDKNQTA